MITTQPSHEQPLVEEGVLTVRLAAGGYDVARCRHMIAEVYNRLYGVVFSRSTVDLAAMIEPYPDRYAMGFIGETHVASCGLYLHRTYAERFGGLVPEEVRAILERAGCAERYATYSLREYTKVVVHPAWTCRGIGPRFLGLTHSPDFLGMETEHPHLLVTCARDSTFHAMQHRAGLRTRFIKPFPEYKMHRHYRSPTDPMTTCLTIPELDIPQRWNATPLPASIRLDASLPTPGSFS